MSSDAEIIIDVDADTKKVDKRIEKLLNEISSKKIELELELKDQSNLKRELKALDDQIKDIGSNRPDNLISSFKGVSSELKRSIRNSMILKEEIKSLSSEYRNLSKQQLNLPPAKVIPDFSAFSESIEKLKKELSNKLNIKDLLEKQLLEFSMVLGEIGKTPLLYSAFDIAYEKMKSTENEIKELKSSISTLTSEYDRLRNEFKDESVFEVLKRNFSSLSRSIKNTFLNTGFDDFRNKLNQISISATSTFEKITNSFRNFNSHAINSSRHVDYFSRRIFNLLRNAFVFNIISRQFRGLSTLLGNLVHRDVYFARSLMIVKANLVRAFAPIWQIILPWIRALGDGLVWISNQLIKFINFLTGSKIKPLEGFKEAKQVVDDFKRIASPTKDLFDLKDPNKYAKELSDNIKRSQQPSTKVSKNANRLARNLRDSQKQTTKLLAKFDKLEVLKFKKIKDPLGLSELSDPKNLDKNKGIDIPINIPSIEDQIADAINNIQDKPLDFYVNDDLGEQITSKVNGLTLPALNFKVDEESENALNNFKEKMMEFWNWLSPLVESIGNFLKSLGESFKRLFDDLNENGTFKMVVGWFTEWKDNLTNFFNTISQNKEQMDTLRNFIIGIGVAFVTYSIVSKISSLIGGIIQIATLLTTTPLGWLVLAAGVFTTLSLNAGTFKEDLENIKNKISGIINFAVKLSQKLGEAIDNFVNSEAVSTLKEVFGLVFRPIGEFLKWLVQNDTGLTILADGILAIGSALSTALIAKKILDLVEAAKALLALFDLSNPVGWISLAISGLVLVVRHWDKIKETAENVFNAIKDAGTKFVNWINDVLSKAFGGIYDMVKKTFGFIGNLIGNPFDFSSISNQLGYSNSTNVPGLAQGSVLKGGDPFLAYLNDQPRGQTNIEAPLSTIVDAFKQALSESNYNNQPNISINASGDMSSFIRMLNFKLQDNREVLGNAFIENIDF